MATTASHEGRQGQCHFHPVVYKTMAAFALAMVVGSWGFVSQGYPTVYVLAVVSGFVLGCLGLAYLVRRVRHGDRRPWRGSAPPAETGESFAHWSNAHMQVWQSRIKGRDALIQATLPIAAVGIGMMLFALALEVALATA